MVQLEQENLWVIENIIFPKMKHDQHSEVIVHVGKESKIRILFIIIRIQNNHVC